MRKLFSTALLFLPGFVFAQWTPGKITTNIDDYTGVPHNDTGTIRNNNISAMHFYMVEEAAFNDFIKDSSRIPSLTEKSKGWQLNFDKMGRVFIAEYRTMSEQSYWYTYNKQGYCTRIESYKEGKAMWQSQNLMKYDGNGYLLQQKITLTDYNTGRPDQAEEFIYKWKRNYRHLYMGYKVTLDRGKTVKGRSTSKRIYSFDGFGQDTLLVKKEPKGGQWETTTIRQVYTRDTAGRITGRKATSDKFTETENWEYDKHGRLVMHSKTIPGSEVVPKQRFFYNSNGLLSAIHFYNGFSEYFMIVKYDHFLNP